MATGTVKWFNNAKGYGFIRPDSGGDDLFVHYSYIEMEGYKSLRAGQPVSYEIREAPKGLHAVNIEATDVPTTQDEQPLDQAPADVVAAESSTRAHTTTEQNFAMT